MSPLPWGHIWCNDKAIINTSVYVKFLQDTVYGCKTACSVKFMKIISQDTHHCRWPYQSIPWLQSRGAVILTVTSLHIISPHLAKPPGTIVPAAIFVLHLSLSTDHVVIKCASVDITISKCQPTLAVTLWRDSVYPIDFSMLWKIRMCLSP